MKNHELKTRNSKQAIRILSLGFMILLILFFYYLEARAAEFSARPSITLREEYDDNIFLTKNNKVDDYITRVLPAIGMDYKAPFWEWTLDYKLNWWYYSRRGENDTSHNLTLQSKTNLINNFLYLDTSDTYASVVLDSRNASTEGNLSINRTDSNNFTISPYMRYQVADSDFLYAGYRYTNIWYKQANSIDRQMHTGFVNIEHVMGPRVTVSAGGEYTADRPDRAESKNDQEAVSLKIIYNISPRIKFDGLAGYRWFDFSNGRDEDKAFYNTGINYYFSEKGYLELRTDSAFTVSPLYGILESRKGQFSAKYGEIVSAGFSIFRREDRYIETDRKDYGTGGTIGFEYKPDKRFTFKASGRYEKDKFMPEGEKREIYGSSEEIGYKLTDKTTVSLSHNYNRENARIDINDYTDNIVAIQLKTSL